MAKQVVVRGHVQGVFFRASTVDLARQHGVTGWVRNDPAGTVTAHLEGPDAGVEAVLRWMRDGGPARARVEGVDVTDAAEECADAFTVRRG